MAQDGRPDTPPGQSSRREDIELEHTSLICMDHHSEFGSLGLRSASMAVWEGGPKSQHIAARFQDERLGSRIEFETNFMSQHVCIRRRCGVCWHSKESKCALQR